MKLFYLIFLAFVLSAAGTGVTWGAQWTLSTQAANTQSAITVADGRNVWSVEGGSSLTNTGEIIHYNGSEWSVQTTTFATETGRFRGAYAYDERHVWVVGNTDNGDNDGLVYFYDGGIGLCRRRSSPPPRVICTMPSLRTANPSGSAPMPGRFTTLSMEEPPGH